MTEWISVKERLPCWLNECLCRVLIPEVGGGYRVDYKVLHITDKPRTWNCSGMIVTHWMPLPELPKEDTL